MEQKLPRSLADVPMQDTQAGLRADTAWYGGYEEIGGVYYARRGSRKSDVMWTFDRGDGPSGNLPPGVITNGEGWSVKDMTEDDALYFRVVDSTFDLGEGITAPVIAGDQSLWVGAGRPEADVLCWECGAGYGNNWCQRIVSEPLAYDGSGIVTLALAYFNDSERCYDGTQIYLLRSDDSELLLNPTTEDCPENPTFQATGGFTGTIGAYDDPASYVRAITREEIGAAQAIRFVIEFKSDGGYSDEDCSYDTIHGPFGTDGISIAGGGIDAFYDFETGSQGWTPEYCNPVGSFAGIENVDCYTILDPCACGLDGNVMEFHANACDDIPTHPIGQHVRAYSPICDDSDNTSPKTIFMEFNVYAEMPRECGVLMRPGWLYYPWICDVTGAASWSPRVGQDNEYFYFTEPICFLWRYGGSGPGQPIPQDAEKVIAIIELKADCAAFMIDPCTCPGGNATPLIDNIAVGVTASIQAPLIGFDTGTQYQDCGTYPQNLFDPRAVVPANVTLDKYLNNPDKPDKAGDSLVIQGPLPGNDPNKRWESRMWWRVAKRGTFQRDVSNGGDTRYKTWKNRVADGKLIDRPVKPEFTFGWMDSAQVGVAPQRNKFISSFREDDDDFRGEGNAETEMIWDDVLVPGTRIDYFITSNYIATPNDLYYYPDTAGGYFWEFEALPSIRTAYAPNCGGAGSDFCAYHPATLYIDMFNGGAQLRIENALRSLLNGLPLCAEEGGCPIPVDRNWDRYDYLDAASNWKTGFARTSFPASNAGMTIQQILGYRTILANTGAFSAGTTEDPDWEMFSQWLVSPDCNANANRQAFLLNGDNTGEILEVLPEHGPSFLRDVLQASLYCDAFNGFAADPDCAPDNMSYCVRLLPVAGGPFGTLVDVDAHGNFCPNMYGFDVFSPMAGGAGNRTYSAEDPAKVMDFEQIVSTNLGAGANYKTILDGVSWHHVTKRNPNPPGGDPFEYCPRNDASVVEGAYGEIAAALRWAFDVPSDSDIPKLAGVKDLAVCQGTYQFASGVDDTSPAGVNRLFQNEPNPFNSRSTISFSLARTGAVEIVIYDVNGRRVKTLVNGAIEAGTHHVVWDGTNDAGHEAGSGVFWSQMKAGSYTSNKKMVILK
jgi:hypothetical protein